MLYSRTESHAARGAVSAPFAAQPGPVDPAHVREVVARVLAGREFAGLGDGGVSVLERLRAWLREATRHLHAWFQSLPAWVSWALAAWALLCLAAIVAHLVHTLWRARGAPDGRHAPSRQASFAALGATSLDLDAIRAACRAAERDGDWERVVRLAYTAAILRLDEAGCLRFAPSKTNRAYLADLARSAAPSTQARFARMTEDFERMVYGDRAPEPALGRRMLSELEGLYGDVQAVAL